MGWRWMVDGCGVPIRTIGGNPGHDQTPSAIGNGSSIRISVADISLIQIKRAHQDDAMLTSPAGRDCEWP